MVKRTLMDKVTGQWRNRVRQCRLRALVRTQEDVARMTGIPRGTISALENNRAFLSAHYALLIGEALRCSSDDLYEKRKAPPTVEAQAG